MGVLKGQKKILAPSYHYYTASFWRINRPDKRQRHCSVYIYSLLKYESHAEFYSWYFSLLP